MNVVLQKSPKPIGRANPTELRTIGDHVRKRRLDLGLPQKEVALHIGVDEATVFNWEAGTASPCLRALPAVIRFLGHDPRLTPRATDLGRRIRHFRQRLGLSIEALAQMLSVDPRTVRGWERRGHNPRPRLRAQLAEVLALQTTSADAGATLGERIRAARLRAGLTQRELAKRVGVGQQGVSEWESGKRTPIGRQRTRVSEILERGRDRNGGWTSDSSSGRLRCESGSTRPRSTTGRPEPPPPASGHYRE